MTKTSLLTKHFAKWQTLSAIPETHFHKDGIINEDLWDKAGVKLCFLMKEPNNPQKEGWKGAFDFREWWMEEVKFKFSRTLSQWAAGVQLGFPALEQLHYTQTHAALRASALVNVKKTGGGGSSVLSELLPHAIRDKDLVLEQLRIIDPQVIILGLSDPPVLRDALFPKVVWKKSGYQIPLGHWEGRVLIDFYHPSAHNAPAAAYCLLEKVMSSKAYKDCMAPIV
jgi:hypothetical protein